MNSYMEIEELLKLGITVYGQNVKISKHAHIYNPKNLILHDNIRIDDFCVLSGPGIIEIKNYVHIGAFCFITSGTRILIDDYSGLSQGVKLYGSNDDYSGDYLINSTIPLEFRNVTMGDIIIEKMVNICAGSVIMPNITIREGSIVGALSLLKDDTDKWYIYGGIPARKIKQRTNNCLKFAKELN